MCSGLTFGIDRDFSALRLFFIAVGRGSFIWTVPVIWLGSFIWTLIFYLVVVLSSLVFGPQLHVFPNAIYPSSLVLLFVLTNVFESRLLGANLESTYKSPTPTWTAKRVFTFAVLVHITWIHYFFLNQITFSPVRFSYTGTTGALRWLEGKQNNYKRKNPTISGIHNWLFYLFIARLCSQQIISESFGQILDGTFHFQQGKVLFIATSYQVVFWMEENVYSNGYFTIYVILYKIWK